MTLCDYPATYQSWLLSSSNNSSVDEEYAIRKSSEDTALSLPLPSPSSLANRVWHGSLELDVPPIRLDAPPAGPGPGSDSSGGALLPTDVSHHHPPWDAPGIDDMASTEPPPLEAGRAGNPDDFHVLQGMARPSLEGGGNSGGENSSNRFSAHSDGETAPPKRLELMLIPLLDDKVGGEAGDGVGGPFRKWMRTLRRQASRRPDASPAFQAGTLPWQFLDESDRLTTSFPPHPPPPPPPPQEHVQSSLLPPSLRFGTDAGGEPGGGRRAGHHRKSSSGSSFGFVAAMKSASISLASMSVGGGVAGGRVTRSRRNTGNSTGLAPSRSRGYSRSRTERSVRSGGPRRSEDSSWMERSVVMDPQATARSLQRRRILEELIETEEGYIGDIRFLMNIYVTILASHPTLPIGLRSSINSNLTEIVELHEEILGELHRAVPNSEYSQLEFSDPPFPATSLRPVTAAAGGQQNGGHGGHHRWRSLDAVPENTSDGESWLQRVPGMIAEPQTAGDVARIFARKMNRLFIYKEYGAKYEMMMRDAASANRTIPDWDTYYKGLEALAGSLGPEISSKDRSRKALTLADLLVKPIQRVCRYPLLFAELLKQTPVTDCPNSHMEVESVLIRLREATDEINRATKDEGMKDTLQKTWLLQDRLVFPNQRLDAASKARVRSFGHVQMCGALHICWQTREGVVGQYMVALLYRDVLCLASAGRADQIYTIQACIGPAGTKIEEADNGRGLQCHTAPFSWKLVFECDYQLYELMITACSGREEQEWRAHLARPNTAAGDPERPQEQREPGLYNSLYLNMKSLGTVFGKPGTIARKMSIHRATTVGPKSPLCHIILKNTSAARDAAITAANSPVVVRSQSLLTPASRVSQLTPPRGDRARLEVLLSDVWSREALPYPGMALSTASTVMRKLSVASLTSTFSKRPSGLASTGKTTTMAPVSAQVVTVEEPESKHRQQKQKQKRKQPGLAATLRLGNGYHRGIKPGRDDDGESTASSVGAAVDLGKLLALPAIEAEAAELRRAAPSPRKSPSPASTVQLRIASGSDTGSVLRGEKSALSLAPTTAATDGGHGQGGGRRTPLDGIAYTSVAITPHARATRASASASASSLPLPGGLGRSKSWTTKVRKMAKKSGPVAGQPEEEGECGQASRTVAESATAGGKHNGRWARMAMLRGLFR